MNESVTTVSLSSSEFVQIAKPSPSASSEGERLRFMLDAHVDFIWRSLRRLGVPDGDLADAVQQVFVVTARKLNQVRDECARPFLYQTALRVASTTRRTRRRRREIGDDCLAERPNTELAPDELADERYRRQLLDRALDAMPLELRAAFVLVDIEELTMAEAAQLLAIPSGTVASRLRRARARFHHEVQTLRAQEGI